MLRRIVMSAVLTALVVAGIGSAAGAHAKHRAHATAEVVAVSGVYLNNGMPVVSGTYKCKAKFSHLWVSSKQGGGGLRQEGSGETARSWYQRTWDQKLNCDGKKHTRLFTLQPTGDTGAIHTGHHVYLQFCLVTANKRSALGPKGHPAFDSNMRFRQVHVLS
jgi:hypothetical protein